MVDLARADAGLRELALFAGAGGGILGGQLLGWHTVCAVEWNAYAASVLCARQNDGLLPPFPIWDDVRTFDGRPWRGRVDVVSGGFPCQDISVAGKGDGLDGERSGLWSEMARIIGEVRPRFAFVENSPALTSRGLGRVLGDLAAMGYDARWGVVSAADVGAYHERQRIWIVAYTDSDGLQIREHVADACGKAHGSAWRGSPDGVPTPQDYSYPECWERSLGRPTGRMGRQYQSISGNRNWEVTAKPVLGGGADGVAGRLDRLAALGNGQVPQAAAVAWRCLMESA